MSDIFDERIDTLPVIRISRMVLENFKSVEYGEVDFACSKKFIPHGTAPDILAVYGQNGSGKSSLVDALDVIRCLLLGRSLPDYFADYIMLGKEYARIEITFDMQYPSAEEGKTGDVRKTIYEVKLGVSQEQMSETNSFPAADPESDSEGSPEYRVKVLSEILKAGGTFGGERRVGKEFLNTQSAKPFGPVTKCKELCPDSEDLLVLKENRAAALNCSKSFVFMDETRSIFEKQIGSSCYADILFDLNLYAQLYLRIIKTGNMGVIRLNRAIPIYFNDPVWINKQQYNSVILNLQKPTRLPDEIFGRVQSILKGISPVLEVLVAGMRIELRSLRPVTLEDNIPGQNAEVIVFRNGLEMPLRYESDGVKKLISTLQLLIESFNDESMTVVIDELDAGIFEYLLGTILEIYEKSGRGQLIFTVHNLRPMELISKNYIIYTTSNPKNRYYRMKDVKTNNNLRDFYLRDIEMNDQDERLYVNVSKEDIVRAFLQAGNDMNEELSQ